MLDSSDSRFEPFSPSPPLSFLCLNLLLYSLTPVCSSATWMLKCSSQKLVDHLLHVRLKQINQLKRIWNPSHQWFRIMCVTFLSANFPLLAWKEIDLPLQFQKKNTNWGLKLVSIISTVGWPGLRSSSPDCCELKEQTLGVMASNWKVGSYIPWQGILWVYILFPGRCSMCPVCECMVSSSKSLKTLSLDQRFHTFNAQTNFNSNLDQNPWSIARILKAKDNLCHC